MKKNLKYIYILLICMIINLPTSVFASSIQLNKTNITLGVGYSETLKYTIEDGANTNNSTVVWTSTNEKVATVDKGKVTAITEGVTIITVTYNGKKSTCRVTVSKDYIPVKEVSINKSTTNLLIGASEPLTASISPSNATNKDVTWESSDESIVTVDSNGQITAKKVGSAIITVYASKKTSTCKVTVVDTVALKNINLNKTTLNIKEKASETLKVIYSPSNATNKNVTWKSSDKSIVTVDSNGKITALKPGSATITVISKDGEHGATCKVTVEELSKKVESVSLDKKELNIIAGKTETLKVTINPDYAENKNVTWKSSDENVAIVKNGEITAKKAGITEIKVISEDGEKEAICKVTVTAPPLEKISFSTSEKEVHLESETSLKPILEPENSILEEAIWTSSDENIATVENGIVTAKSIGESTITVSTKDNKITSSIKIIVIEKPKEKLNITVEGYDLKFDPNTKNYTLTIGDESELKINSNVEQSKITINGNKNLKNGSIITITVTDGEKTTYIIEVNKKQNYTIYFIAIISVLLLLNLIRLLIKNKKKKY